MMKVQINVVAGDKSARIRIDDATREILENLVAKTFQVIGGRGIEPIVKRTSEKVSIELKDLGQEEVSLIDLLPEQIRDWYEKKKKVFLSRLSANGYGHFVKVKVGRLCKSISKRVGLQRI